MWRYGSGTASCPPHPRPSSPNVNLKDRGGHSVSESMVNNYFGLMHQDASLGGFFCW